MEQQQKKSDGPVQCVCEERRRKSAEPEVVHGSVPPGELSQWLCHDDSTINIVVLIIIIITYLTTVSVLPVLVNILLAN